MTEISAKIRGGEGGGGGGGEPRFEEIGWKARRASIDRFEGREEEPVGGNRGCGESSIPSSKDRWYRVERVLLSRCLSVESQTYRGKSEEGGREGKDTRRLVARRGLSHRSFLSRFTITKITNRRLSRVRGEKGRMNRLLISIDRSSLMKIVNARKMW